jgi:hypothetical protein
MARQQKPKKPSPYTILNKWLFDNNKNSVIPEEIVKDKSINSHYILYFFQGSKYQMLISEMFNNYGVYSLDRLEVFKLIKEAVRMSGFRPAFIPRYNNSKTKLSNALKAKFPYLKYNDVNLLVDQIEVDDDRDVYYEMLNLKAPKKHKTKKEAFNKLKELKSKPKEVIKEVVKSNAYTWSELIDNFEIKEI